MPEQEPWVSQEYDSDTEELVITWGDFPLSSSYLVITYFENGSPIGVNISQESPCTIDINSLKPTVNYCNVYTRVEIAGEKANSPAEEFVYRFPLVRIDSANYDYSTNKVCGEWTPPEAGTGGELATGFQYWIQPTKPPKNPTPPRPTENIVDNASPNFSIEAPLEPGKYTLRIRAINPGDYYIPGAWSRPAFFEVRLKGNISTFDELQGMSLNGNYILANDIDCAGQVFTPIGNCDNKFTGKFNGNGYAIKNLSFDNNNQAYVGLFGYIWQATISNVALLNPSFSGKGYVGALAGKSHSSTITNCFAAGDTTIKVPDQQSGQYVGGLVGYLEYSTISNCYANVSVSAGGPTVGGLVGQNAGSTIENCYAGGDAKASTQAGGLVGASGDVWKYSVVKNCYATGLATGRSSIGGLVGDIWPENTTNTFNNSYYDKKTTGRDDSGKGVGESDEAMKTKATFTGWDFNNTWIIKEGSDYPRLRWQQGTPENPLPISTCEQLQAIGQNPEGLLMHYELVNDIDCSGIDNFTPIGNSDQPFIGGLNGNGFFIKNITINASADYAGLFGVAHTAIITDVGLIDVNIVCHNYTGGLVGSCDDSVIKRSFATGKVNGRTNVSNYVGGLVGENKNSSIIENTYATVAVTGKTGVGGLVGDNSGSSLIENCYANGKVNGSLNSNFTGGLVGSNSSSQAIANSYYDQGESGQNDSGKGEGKSDQEMKRRITFVDWDFMNTWSIVEELDYPRLR